MYFIKTSIDPKLGYDPDNPEDKWKKVKNTDSDKHGGITPNEEDDVPDEYQGGE